MHIASTLTLLSPLLLVAAFASAHAPTGPGISVAPWGTVDGKEVHLWTMKNCNGMEAQITDYGTIIVALKVPDMKGAFTDVVLGRSSAADYVARTQYFGCTAGRCANRIAGGTFTIDGVVSTLAKNNGVHHLHGGVRGFDKVVWSGVAAMTQAGPSITFTYRSVDGEEGYPGNVDAKVVYTITDANELKVDMSATTDKPTPVNLAHHTYWNLAGHASGSVLEHTLQLPASHYTPVDATFIPTGEIKSVAGTPLDFTTTKVIGQDFAQLPAVKEDPGGYDHNFVLDRKPVKGSLWLSAVLTDPKSGRRMEVWSNQRGIQFYSGNFLDGVPGKDGAVYAKNAAVCLETQVFPDAVHQRGVEGWPEVVLLPGQQYEHHMVHAFSQAPVQP
ncbi:MAG: galactose mutarotase [Phycisphaerales bacterium]|nr:galactose mutarotase [Phycisphaerales bacterium]